MMDIQAIPIGSTSTNTSLESLLGVEIEVNNAIPSVQGVTRYRLVKTANATSIANGRPVIWSSIAARTVDGAAAGASAVRGSVAGFAVLSPINAAYAATTLAATGTYFWVAIRGPVYSNAMGSAPTALAALATQTDGAVGSTAAAAFNTNVAIALTTATAAGTVILADLTN